MPAEWEPHERTWMAWPTRGYTLGETAAEADRARRTWAAVAHAVSTFEPVTMLVDPSAVNHARAHLAGDVELVEVPLDDAWARDIGPTFVRTPDGLAAVDWVFNGWGAQGWATWTHDAGAARAVAATAGVRALASPLVNEGGGIHTDGAGTVLATRTVQLDPGRNPGWDEAGVEAELRRTLGARRVVWLDGGLTRDSGTFGTRGHVDIVACFTPGGPVLVHDQRDPAHPDHAVSAQVRATLAAAGFEVVALPAPRTLRDDEGFVDWSYVNHEVVNGGVVVGTFDDPGDDTAIGILRELYPGREVVGVDARALFDRGGGVHCITQQQPATTKGRP